MTQYSIYAILENNMLNSEYYEVYYYQNTSTKKVPVLTYIFELSKKERAKIQKYIDFLALNKGYLDEPYSKHIVVQKIILLHSFLKKTGKAPQQEINRALQNLSDCEINNSFVQYEH